ncbi:MAG: acetate--CoA ligase [Gemmatimonadales bacterium]
MIDDSTTRRADPSRRPTSIAKRGRLRRAPNVPDIDALRAHFDWEAARADLEGLPAGGLNIAHEAVDRHGRGAGANRIAIRWLGRSGTRRDITYRELMDETARFANVLGRLGVTPGDGVFVLLARVPDLYVAVLGSLKARCVVTPLFAAFGPEPIRSRLDLGSARVLVTTPSLFAKKVAPIRDRVPSLEQVLLLDEPGGDQPLAGTTRLAPLMGEASAQYDIAATDPEGRALVHFTSGTTGRPKGAIHVHAAVVAHHATGRIALDFQPGDVFWCTADPGWVTGTSYGIISPLTHGITLVVDEAEFDAVRWYRILEEERVSVWYTAPTAIRMMIKAGADPAGSRRFPDLRFIASVGEPLDAAAVFWGEDALGLPIHDNWWQTETGGIMIANYASMDIRPGSMGKPLPGIEAAIVRRLGPDRVEVVAEPGQEGELALRPGWPSMFRGYLNEDERYRACFVGGWYLTGDLARRDEDDYFWFVGRADDVIKSAGHLIGPFEVESVLLEHPSVAEAAVIGKPDPIVGDVVKGFVSLKSTYEHTDGLAREILAHARRRLGPAVAPKELVILDTLPRTRSGKILRRLLRARELGLPEGDLSTLEPPP